jgi:hypothetical protein
MTLKLITFKTNHTILAQAELKDTHVVVKQPVQVVMQPTKEGPMMGFSPFIEYCEEFGTGIELDTNDILCITTPVVELQNQYNQVFGSGIQIASAIPKL